MSFLTRAGDRRPARAGWSVASMATVVAALTGCAQPALRTVSTEVDERQVAAADDAYVAAEARHDEATMRRMIDDRFAFNSADGTTTGKEAFIPYVLKLPIVSETLRERSILVEGDVALVFATTDIHFAPPNKPESTHSLRYTCAYVRRDGQWRLLALQIQPRDAK